MDGHDGSQPSDESNHNPTERPTQSQTDEVGGGPSGSAKRARKSKAKMKNCNQHSSSSPEGESDAEYEPSEQSSSGMIVLLNCLVHKATCTVPFRNKIPFPSRMIRETFANATQKTHMSLREAFANPLRMLREACQ